MQFGLKGSTSFGVTKMIAIFLYILGNVISNRLAQEQFQYSGETISRYFGMILQIVCDMWKNLIQPSDQQFKVVPQKIKNDRRYYPYFKVIYDCII